MLITSLIFGCLGPVLTTVALLGQRVLRPARLAQEKYDLHAFFKTLPKALASDHLLFHFIYRTWKANGHDFGQELYRYSSLFSRPSLRRLDESRNQIFRELKGNFGLSGEDVDVNASNDSLVRLILASGFYPDVAIAKDRRNTFRLKKLPSATIGSSSMNYILGSGSIRNALEARGQRSDPLGLDKRRRRDGVHPQFVIYEELLDIGQKLVSKTTAIDPLSFILFAERYDYRFYKSGTEKIHKQLHLDGWLAYRAEKDPSDLSLINELRQHWNDFVQFVIYKQLKKETLSEHEEECVRAIKETIIMFANEMDIHRSMQQDRSVQVHASEAFQLQHARKSPSIEEQ